MKNKGRKHGCRFDPDEIMLMVLIFVLLGFGILALKEIGSLVWNAITNIRVTDPAQEETAEGETLSAEAPAEGIGRAPAVTRYLGAPEAMEIDTAEREILETYTEGEGPAPAWYRPDEPMSAEWEDSLLTANSQTSCRQVTETNEEAVSGDVGAFCGEAEQVRKDAGCPDWNVDSTLYGWDGRTMEAWEMDLFAQIYYLEFWGADPMCCEAGCDAILRLWETGYYGPTMFDTLSGVNEDGSLAFSTYADMWGEVYDPDGLAWCREYCRERFENGPEWIAPYFRKSYYHDWAVPAYQIGEVYFSVGKAW